jgi:hypothetical protein
MRPGAFSRLGDVVGLDDPSCGEAGGVVEVGLARPVERVVRRTVLARPRSGGKRGPTDAGVGREALEETIAGGLDTLVEQVLERRHGPFVHVLVYEILAHAVGGEQNRLLRTGYRKRHRGRPLAGESRPLADRDDQGGCEQREACRHEPATWQHETPLPGVL